MALPPRAEKTKTRLQKLHAQAVVTTRRSTKIGGKTVMMSTTAVTGATTGGGIGRRRLIDGSTEIGSVIGTETGIEMMLGAETTTGPTRIGTPEGQSVRFDS